MDGRPNRNSKTCVFKFIRYSVEGATGLIGARVESRGSNIITAPRGREEEVRGGGRPFLLNLDYE